MQSTDITIGPNVGFLAVLNLLGAAQGVLLALALVTTKTGRRTANRLLAALTLTISISVSGAVLLTSNYVFAFPHLSRLHQPFVFLAAPLLFLYLRELTARERRFERKDFLHFIPFLLCLIYLLPYFLQSGAAKIQILVSEYVQPAFGQWYYVRSAVLITQVLVYLVLIAVNIVNYSRSVKLRKSPRERAVLFEVRFFVIATAVLWCTVVLRYAIATMPNLLVPLGASLLIYAMGYLKMRRPEPQTNGKGELSVKKYEKSRLTPERSDRYLDKLLNFMRKEKPFTDGDLTIQKLAERLSIPAHHLSQTINEQLGQTFSDFINSYRVEEAKKKLLDPALKHLSVLGIAEEVGFNSKSSFNSVFKKHTNMTPSEFRNAAAPASPETEDPSIEPSLDAN
ncbi:MAG TPA: helix-turn-helix transcriptional regulator [Pyrinomonadaceae bacterium]|nr:helix-turn-helix transcriptional regulator [Pyrinomonadaceae bacterium]